MGEKTMRNLVDFFRSQILCKKNSKKKIEFCGTYMEETVVTCKDVLKEMPNGERPFESWRLQWVICTTHDAEKIKPGVQWRIAAKDKEKLKHIFLAVSLNEQKNQIRRSYCSKWLKEK